MDKKDKEAVQYFAQRLEEDLPPNHSARVDGEHIYIETNRPVGEIKLHWREVDWLIQCFMCVRMDAQDNMAEYLKEFGDPTKKSHISKKLS